MWNDGKNIIWYHFWQIVNDELKSGLKSIPKLSLEHVQLNPYSVMSVKLATQILSDSVSKILFEYYPEDTHATALLCKHMDSFFDIMNVRNRTEGVRKNKPFLRPYTDVNDERFKWLMEVFLPYLSSWKESTQCRPGNFTQNARS